MQRNSSFELLRLLLMLLITIHHFIVIGMGLAYFSGDSQYSLLIQESDMPFYLMVNAFCVCSVNCFVLISGYFGIRLTKKKLLYLLATLLFYLLLFAIIPNLVRGNIQMAAYWCLFLSHTPYWFFTDYIFLMIMAPAFNVAFERLDRNTLKVMLIGMAIISFYFGFIWKHPANADGYTLFQFMFMYSVGRWIALKDFSIPRCQGIVLYGVSAILCGLLSGFFCLRGDNDMAWWMTRYNSPLVVMSAIGLFMIFKTFRFTSKNINKWALSSFAIYLIQSSPVISKVQYDSFRLLTGADERIASGVANLLVIVLFALSVVALSIAFDRIRIFLFKFIFK